MITRNFSTPLERTTMDSVDTIVEEMRAFTPPAGPATISTWADRLAALAPAGVGEPAFWVDSRALARINRERGNEYILDIDAATDPRGSYVVPVYTARPDSVSEAADAARYRWLRDNFKASFCRSTSDYWEIHGEHKTPRQVFTEEMQLTLDSAIDAALEAARAPGGES